MRLNLVAYATDCLVCGAVELDDGRLSDTLVRLSEIVFQDAVLQALDDGRMVEVERLAVPLDEVCVVEVQGPRGDPRRRVRTIRQTLSALVGPYTVTADLHALPTAEALASVLRRGPIVPMTDAKIEFYLAGEPMRHRADVVAVVREQIVSLQQAIFHATGDVPEVDWPARL